MYVFWELKITVYMYLLGLHCSQRYTLMRFQYKSIRPNPKISVFSVTRSYLNLLVKPRIFFRFSGKIYNFMHFERQNAFQNVENYIFFSKKIIKNVCAFLT